jgi:dCMP deaminase
MLTKYDKAYLKMAQVMAETSTATRLKVGCIIVKDNQILSDACNGTYPKCPTNTCEDAEGLTTKDVLHAEEQGILKAARNGRALNGSTFFITHSPCIPCAVKIIAVGACKVVYSTQYRCSEGLNKLLEAGVDVVYQPT